MSRRELQVLRRRLEQRSKDVTQLHSVSKLLAQERSTDHLDDAQAEADFGLAVCIINEDWKVQNAVRSALDSDRAGILVNASRGILYAGDGADYASAAHDEARRLRDEINAARG